MGKSEKKTGKGRLDKYYKLAKEQGYRARSAFKLIQLNKKFQFLEQARCCIDLCAAPGGWLQVASKYMPTNSLIVGVDLVPIRPIPRVATFAADITTANCRTQLRSHLKDWKADVVLHDGAPNVGTAWVQDAFTQSELVLSSLKLAVEFLIKGGTFVTKVFRSQDYNNLLWVFNQLFSKVEATKPPSSRNVSAEIFVVCSNFLAPAYIDPKFLDPKHVFKEVSTLPPAPSATGPSSSLALTPAVTNVFQPSKKRRHRDGYADGDYTLFKAGSAGDFVRTVDPVTFLGTYNKIEFITDEEKAWLSLEGKAKMSSDVKACFDDLKLLGKGDFKALLKWRLLLREEIGLDSKTKAAEELTETVEVTEEPVDEDQQIEDELERLNAQAAARTKRDRRRANEKKTKQIQRMQLSMTAPMDIGQEFSDQQLVNGGGDFFDLGEAEKRGMRDMDDDESDSDSGAQAAEDDDAAMDSDDERERKLKSLEGTLDGMYEDYQQRMSERDAKWKARQARLKDKKNETWSGIRRSNSDDESDSDAEDQAVKRAVVGGNDEGSDAESEGGWDVVQRVKNRIGESDDSDDSSDESADEEELPSAKKRKASDGKALSVSTLVTKLDDGRGKIQSSKAAQVWFSQDVFKGIGDEDAEEDEDEEDEDDDEDDDEAEAETLSEEEEDDFEVVPQQQSDDEDATMWDVEDEDQDRKKARTIRKHGLTTAEAVTMAQQLVNRQTTKTHLINDGFNRYSLNSKEDLPDWFLDDESKFYKPNIPITKEAINMLRAKQRALDARPIKKVAEAKARKKMRAVQRYEKAVNKAEGVTQNGDMTERDKAGAIEKLLKKGLSGEKKKKNEVKVVYAKGAAKGVKGRPKGVKGRYQMVDSRGKKEVRAKKRTEKANKKRKRT